MKNSSLNFIKLIKIPLQRDFFGKVDYQHRNAHDDFLEQLPLTTNEVAKEKEIVPKNPRLLIGEGFYDKAN